MKPVHPWHRTRFGRLALFLGSIELAVPVMLLVAGAMGWGTYLESTKGAQASRASVYGSWWFIALMALICVSLVFAVVARFPLKRRHVGFTTVHAGLIMLIAGGFWSLFGRVEGHLALDEGTSGSAIETDEELIQLFENPGADSAALAAVPAPKHRATFELAATRVELLERWENCTLEQRVEDDAPAPFRAIEIAFNPDAPTGEWIGEEAAGAAPVTIQGLTIRVLKDSSPWEPPAPSPEPPEFFFAFADRKIPLGAVGSEPIPGWTIESIERFARALVADGKITDAGTRDNPAVELVLRDAAGTREKHTCFRNFPDMLLVRTLEGSGKSGASLAAASRAKHAETLVVFGPAAAPRFGFIDATGAGRELPAPASFPATIELPSRPLRVLNHFANARSRERFVRAPFADDRRPALLVRVPGNEAPIVVPWKGSSPISLDNRTLHIAYAPRVVPLPFTITLNDFRKMDYPGTETAMAYESDVLVSAPDTPDIPFVIHMNAPYASGPWKVYQSGFSGSSVSIFSVMRDPGLSLTYLGSAVLCVGIFVTFFSRSLSWGHPGIPLSPAESKA